MHSAAHCNTELTKHVLPRFLNPSTSFSRAREIAIENTARAAAHAQKATRAALDAIRGGACIISILGDGIFLSLPVKLLS